MRVEFVMWTGKEGVKKSAKQNKANHAKHKTGRSSALRASTRLPLPVNNAGIVCIALRSRLRFVIRTYSPNMEDLDSQDVASQDIAQETPAQDVFIAPSIHQQAIIAGASYTHHSATPEVVTQDLSIECVLGVDEAGRGPVLGRLS